MADFAPYLQNKYEQQQDPSFSKKIFTSKVFASKHAYQDVFRGAEASNDGMQCFSSRVEDYTEIFTSCNSSRASSIPFLNLPLVVDDEDQTDFSLRSHCDYSEIFGGFDSLDYAVPYEELFVQPTVVDPSSSEDLVWTPAETGSPSEESSEDPVSFENNQAFSNAVSHYGYDDAKQFNVSYHKINQISKADGISGTTHIAQLNAVPAFTVVVDENLPLHTAKCDSSLHEEVNDHSLNANNIDCRMDGEHFWETTPTQVSCGSDLKSQKNLDGKEIHTEKPFVTVSEISLRTLPCEVPPPSRSPPKLTVKHGYHKSATSNLKYTANYTHQGTNDWSPHFYDVEVDSGSSAAASAAAMKEAMEIAQARLKSAKEMMERKKDGLQYRKKVGLNECKGDERSESEIAHDVRVKDDELHIKHEKKGSDRVEKEKSMENSHESLDSELQRGLLNFSEEYVEHKHPKERKLTQGSQRQEVIGEWKAEEQFYELVKNDTIERAFIAAENKSRKKKIIPTTAAYQHGENEMQAEKVAFVQEEKSDGRVHQVKMACELEQDTKTLSVVNVVGERKEHCQRTKVAFVKEEKSDGRLHEVKMACELEEDTKTLSVANVVGERKEHCQTTKAVQKICDQEEHGKRHNESCEVKNEICAQEDYEKRLNATHEQGKKECHEREEYLKKLKEAHEMNQKEGIEPGKNEKKMQEALHQEEGERREREACEREEFERKREDFIKGESERRQKEAHEKEENEMRLNGSRQMESRQREENEKRQQEAREREENGRRLKESQELQEMERNLKQAAEENERRLKEIGEMEENEKRQKVIEMEEYEFFLTETDGKQEKEFKEKHSAEENEWELQSVHEKEENERKETEECEREENENRFEVSYKREENERKLKQATEENERMRDELQEREENMIHKDPHNHEKNQKRLKDLCEVEATEKLLQKETCVWVDNEKKLRDSQELKEKRPEESCKCESQNIELETGNSQEQIKKSHSNAFERDENDQYELSQDFHLSEEDNNLKVDTLYVEVAEQKEELLAEDDVCMQDEIMDLEATRGGWEQEENNEQLIMDQESCREETDNILKIAQNASEHIENVKNFKEDKVSYELDKTERLRAVNMPQGCSVECEGNGTAVLKAKVDDSKKEPGNSENTLIEERDGKCMKEVPGVLNFKDTRKSVKTSQRMGQSTEDGMKIEVVHPITEEEKSTNRKLADQFNTHQERKENNLKGHVAREVGGKEGRIKDREQERERLKKLEDRLRDREREKDRIAVERVTREARERAFAETRERAERAAVERATAEVRQRAMLEARERLEKACAEAREKSLAEKAYAESRLRAERAAVERATAEARARAVEKAMAERAAMEARVDRSVSEKFSAVSRDRDLRHSASFSDMRNAHFQSSSSFSSSQRYTNTSNHRAFTNEIPQGTEVESAQRCKAKLERHQRTVERAAKALAEKNLRDQLAQKEQAERNRLADTLDADVKRWSSGKEGNLRALLSTLQYILGPESGWQPIPLTDVITAAAVKKAYRKATLCVHPDKLQQRSASIQQKYICEKVFDLLKDAWSKFNSEER